MAPKRRFWTAEQRVAYAFLKYFFKGVSTSFGLQLIENLFKNAYATLCSAVQNRRLVSIKLNHAHQYVRFVNWPTQSGVAISRKCCFPHGWTTRCVCVFEVLFKGLSTRFGLQLIENSFKNAYATLCRTLEKSSFGEHNFPSFWGIDMPK